MTNPFSKPSDADQGVKVTDFEGALCIFTYRSEREHVKTRFDKPGEEGKPAVVVDIDCVEGVPAGTISQMPPQGFGKSANVLVDKTGESASNVLIFQGFLRGSFRGRREGDMVLGRIRVEGKITNQSTNDQDLKASWMLIDADEADTAKAVEYLNKKQASSFSKPAAATAPAAQPALTGATSSDEPNF